MSKKKMTLLEVGHELAQGLHTAGIIDDSEMKEFDTLCCPENKKFCIKLELFGKTGEPLGFGDTLEEAAKDLFACLETLKNASPGTIPDLATAVLNAAKEWSRKEESKDIHRLAKGVESTARKILEEKARKFDHYMKTGELT